MIFLEPGITKGVTSQMYEYCTKCLKKFDGKTDKCNLVWPI